MLMSASGQKRMPALQQRMSDLRVISGHSQAQKRMSALPPKADMCGAKADVG